MAMKRIFDEVNRVWLWISSDETIRMSPAFNSEDDALAWRVQIAQEHASEYDEIRFQLDQLNSGESIVVPKNKLHAESMLRIAHFYLDHNKTGNENEPGTN